MSSFQPRILLLFSNATLSTAGTLLSDPFNVGKSQFASYQYTLNAANTLAVMGTVQILCSVNSSKAGFVVPTKSTGADVGYIGYIDSNPGFRSFDFPMADLMQVRLTAATNNTATIDGFWVIFDDIV